MRKLWATVLAFLQIQAFEESEGVKMLTAEQKQKLTEHFGAEFATKFDDDLKRESKGQAEETNNAEAVAAFQSTIQALEAEKTKLEGEKTALLGEKQQLEAANKGLRDAVKVLSGSAEPSAPGKPAAEKPSTDYPVDEKNDKFLFGQQFGFMAIDDAHPYNKRAYAALMAKHGIEIPVVATSSLDYSSLKTDLGEYYRVRKQDRIQSFLMKLPSIESIFPLESGYQDQAVLTNMFLTGEFSQADNTVSSSFDNVVKGGFKFEPEVITMYDVMFAHKFQGLKELEKNWLGYLNREGSDTMKWSFIEYILAETGKKLHNERELRRVNGKRVNPTANVPGTAMGASNGLRVWLKNQLAAYKLRPFPMGDFTDTTISEYVRIGTASVPAVVRDSGMLVLYMSPDNVTKYHKNNEQLYGGNVDYKANIMYVKEYPNVRIQAVPNMNESHRMVWTISGNISLFEDKPGEMYNFNIEQQDWSLKVWSNWKESVWAYLVGKKYSSLEEIPEDYSTQLIFCNDIDEPTSFYIPMTADDTTPSVAQHTSLVSVANSAATAITNIDDCAVGQEVWLKCGSTTNAPTIAASGNFSLLTAAWEPALGDILKLKKRSDGKFIELERITASSNAIAIAADDATPDVSEGTVFITNANTTATAITALDNSITGVIYTIYGAGSTNASTIANSGNFVLTAAMTLSAGTWIKLQKSATNSKYYEISRSA